MDVPKEAEALFAVMPDEFVDERKRIVRELRAAGRRDDADVVAALKKPPPVVLAANRAARDRSQAARAAAKAAQRVAKTQLGSEPDVYRTALAELDEALDLLAQVALARLSVGGKPPSEVVTRRLHGLLRNAVADEGARTALTRGALREEPETAGFGAFAGVTPPSSRRKRSTKPAQDNRRREDEKRRERERALRDQLAAAEKALDDALREERRATHARERAERALDSAKTRLGRLLRVED